MSRTASLLWSKMEPNVFWKPHQTVLKRCSRGILYVALSPTLSLGGQLTPAQRWPYVRASSYKTSSRVIYCPAGLQKYLASSASGELCESNYKVWSVDCSEMCSSVPPVPPKDTFLTRAVQ